jgi:hypothetical protein
MFKQYLITGRSVEDTEFVNRFLWFISGWCALLDGLTTILSCGYLSFALSYGFSKWRLQRRINRREKMRKQNEALL